MIVQIKTGGFDDNFSYLIIDENTKETGIVDPCGDTNLIIKEIEKQNLIPKAVLVTHSHFDHVEGIPDIVKRYDVPVYIHENAKFKNSNSKNQTIFIDEGDEIRFGGITVTVMHTPGHIDDAVCYYLPEGVNDTASALITGDTLFVEGCGRTNRDDAKDLYKSLFRLAGLPPRTKVYTGHDYGSIPISTIKHEKEHNRFLLVKDFNGFLKERFG